MDKTSFGFPFEINSKGRVNYVTGDENIRAKIMQVLFTSPGERTNLPEFGCGLLNLVFDPNNSILSTATEFNIRVALNRWLGKEIMVETVDVENDDERMIINIVYIRKDNLEKQAIKINY